MMTHITVMASFMYTASPRILEEENDGLHAGVYALQAALPLPVGICEMYLEEPSIAVDITCKSLSSNPVSFQPHRYL